MLASTSAGNDVSYGQVVLPFDGTLTDRGDIASTRSHKGEPHWTTETLLLLWECMVGFVSGHLVSQRDYRSRSSEPRDCGGQGRRWREVHRHVAELSGHLSHSIWADEIALVTESPGIFRLWQMRSRSLYGSMGS